MHTQKTFWINEQDVQGHILKNFLTSRLKYPAKYSSQIEKPTTLQTVYAVKNIFKKNTDLKNTNNFIDFVQLYA